MRSNKPILYTSADSVMQIACHEDSYGLEKPVYAMRHSAQVSRQVQRPVA